MSPRPTPLVAVNCAALSTELLESELFGHVRGSFTGAAADHPGKFLQASGGTLFLDEVGDMDLRLQAKILRVLQERAVDPVGSTRTVPVDVRLVAATNQDLPARVREGLFREDLYYRLNVISIVMPPLRHRGEDVLLLFGRFYRNAGGGDAAMEPQVRDALLKYGWPGNVRELINLGERLANLHPRQSVTLGMLPPEIAQGTPVGADAPPVLGGGGLWEMEGATVSRALNESGGNKSAAARALRIPRHVLLYRIKKFELE